MQNDRNLPEDARSYYELGQSYRGMAMIDEAMVHFRKALHRANDYVDAVNGLWTCCIDKQLYTEAYKIMHEAVQRNPGSAALRNNLGLTCRALGQNELARAEFFEARRLDPGNYIVYVNLAELFLSFDKYSLAVENYRKAIELHPGDAWLHCQLGCAHLAHAKALLSGPDTGDRRREIDAAALAFADAVQADPRNTQVYYLLGCLHRMTGDAARAADAFESLLRIDDQSREAADALRYLGELCTTSDRDKSIEYYKRAAQLQPAFAAYFDLAGMYGKAGRSCEAIAAYGKAIECEPENASAFQACLEIGKALYAMDLHHEALAYINRAIALRSGLDEAYYYRVLIHCRFGDAENAEQDVRELIEGNPIWLQKLQECA